MRMIGGLSLLLPLLATLPAHALDLYESGTIVSGMDDRSRPEGLRRILHQVLSKVSGNPAWLDDPRVDQAAPEVTLEALAYLDRFTDMPKHDEQGSRDRPYDLIARFDRAAIDSLLRGWGDRPWPQPRPVLAVTVTITPRIGPPYALRADTDVDERHRRALLAAADRAGLPIAILTALHPRPRPADSVELTGTVTWSDTSFGWNSTWSVERDGTRVQWTARGESFDAAYRTGLYGAAAALSGHQLATSNLQ